MKKENNAKKKRNPIFLILILVALYIVLVLVFCLISTKTISGETLLNTIKNIFVYVIYVVVIGLVGVYMLVNWRLSEKKNVMKENDLSDSHFMTMKEIKKSKAFFVTSFDKLGTVKDGIPFRAEVKKDKVTIVGLRKPIHATVLGTTGTGKTSGYFDPTLQIMSEFKTKPCLIVSDPKGELYRHHKAHLEEKGYTVKVLDYRNPYQSAKINPFQPIIDRILLIRNQITNEKGKYYAYGEEYQTYIDAEKTVASKRQELMDEIYENMQDLIYTMFPIKDGKEPGWEEGARNLIFGLCLLFVDDVMADNMPIEKLCILNIYQNLVKYCTEDMEVLKAYFDTHESGPFYIKAFGLAKTVLITTERTLTSYLSKVSNYISFLADGGIQCMTSGNEITVDSFDEKPNAIFLVYPDEKDNRHVLVSLFIVQTYKTLVNRAALNLKTGLTTDAELRRNCYFFLDEFGNLPKIENFDKMTSVGRSRKMFFICVLQSYSQLDAVYGKDKAETIKGQLQIKIFLGTDDKKSVEEFSWLCGKKKIYTLSASVGIGKDANDTYSAKEQPLITTEELMTLNNADNFGNAIISFLGHYPIKTVFTPAYKATHIYSIGNDVAALREAEIFDESKFVYDIADSIKCEVTELEVSEEEIQEFEELRKQEEQENARIMAQQMKINGIKTTIKNKLDFVRDYIPADVYSAISSGAIGERISAVDKYMESCDGIKSVEYELCYIKTLLQRLCGIVSDTGDAL